MKCDMCGNKIQEIFLKKIVGTVIKDSKNKYKYICKDCQKKYKTKEDMLFNMK